ncbi:DUF4349 domain-containing protein [Patescibacteria group bacterium]|nr:DUF4349 domain-containing protein [Patescibacteria group bacterium]
MTYTFLGKIKKFWIYPFAFFGVIVVLWFIFQIVFGAVTLRNTTFSGGGTQGLGSAPGIFSGAGLFETQKFAQDDVSPQPFQEGELTQRNVIKNGTLSLLVKNAEEVAQSIQALAERLDGFIQNSRIYEVSDGVKSGNVTIRVPADDFNEAMSEIKKMATKVESENVNARDVTEQFVDLEARLKNFRAGEEQYLRIMDQADTVQDTLQVAQQLNRVRGQIEQIEGQLQFLSSQVDMSTITVSMTAEADIEVFGIQWRPLFILKQAFRDMLGGLTGYINAMIRFAFQLPVLLLWLATILVVLGIGWRVVQRIWQRFFGDRSPTRPAR